MVVEEGERRADGEAVQPQRDLGQLDRERVLVDAVDTALEHHAADDRLVAELAFVDDPVGGAGPFQDLAPDRLDAVDQGRNVVAVEPGDRGRHAFDQLGDRVREVVDRGDEKVAAAHGRVEDLEIENGLRRVVGAELRGARGLVAAARPVQGRVPLEALAALVDERAERALDDQVDERLGRVEAAAVLARVAVGAHRDFAVLAAHRFALEQTLVDRAELLDGHVAVVDVAAAAVAPGVAEVVDDGGQHRVVQLHLLQQGRGLGRKEAAIVGRQADRGVALVDLAAERSDVAIVVASDPGKDVPLAHARGDIVAHRFAQAVVVVAAVVDREQVAVLGIEEEEQAVEQDEGSLADISPDLRRCSSASERTSAG